MSTTEMDTTTEIAPIHEIGPTAASQTAASQAADSLDLMAELTEDLAERAVRVGRAQTGGATTSSGVADVDRMLRAIDRMLAAVVLVLMGADRRQVVASEGLTTDSWLRAVAGRTGADAGMLLVAAERLVDMPATLAAFCDGVLSWGTVRGMVAAVRSLSAAQRQWVDDVVASDRTRLGRVDADTVVSDAERAAEQARPDLMRDRADRAAASQRLVLQPSIDGGGSAFASLDAETFATLQTAIESITHDANGRRVASNVEALRALARQRVAYTSGGGPVHAAPAGADASGGAAAPAGDDASHDADADADADTDARPAAPAADDAARGDEADVQLPVIAPAGAGGAPSTARPEMIIVTDVSLLAEPFDGLDHRGIDAAVLERVQGVARVLWRQDRPAPSLTPDAVQRLACDATLRPVLTDGARVLGTAEPYARVSAPLRTALIARDGGCRFPACHRPVDVCEAHHIVHRVDAGPTVLSNLVLLCGAHHRAVHEGGWKPTLHDDGELTVARRGTTLHSQPRCAQPPSVGTAAPTGRPPRSPRSSRSSRPGSDAAKSARTPGAPDDAPQDTSVSSGGGHGGHRRLNPAQTAPMPF